MSTETPVGRYEFEQFRQTNENQHMALSNRIGGIEAKMNYVLGGIGVVALLVVPVLIYVVQEWITG